MAVDKNKVIAEATKHAQRGQWDKAIKSYDRILAEDAKDVRVLLKVGELHQKRGDDQSAAATFNRVAEAYTEQGFFLKAIAVYKQMMKLTPDDVRVNERLAGLYQQLGIMIDAMGQLQLVAQAAERSGNNSKLLEVLRRMTELEPENVGSAVKLGEIQARAGQTAEALVEFRRAAEILKRNNRADEYLRVAERIAFLAPADLDLTRELANIYLAKGDTKRALAKLQLCFKADSKDVATLNLLAQAFRDLGQTSKTVSVWKELAHVQAERGRVDESRATWRKVLELSPDDPDAAAGLAGDSQVPSLTPVFTPAAELPAPAARAPSAGPPPGARPPSVIAPPPPSRDPPPVAAPAARSAAGSPRPLGPEAIPKLLTETDVYVKYGLHQKALDHLRKVFEIDPGHLDAREKARDLRRAAGDAAGAADEAARAVRIAIDHGLTQRARAAVAKLRELAPGHPDLAALEAGDGQAPRADHADAGPAPAALLGERERRRARRRALEAAGAAATGGRGRRSGARGRSRPSEDSAAGGGRRAARAGSVGAPHAASARPGATPGRLATRRPGRRRGSRLRQRLASRRRRGTRPGPRRRRRHLPSASRLRRDRRPRRSLRPHPTRESSSARRSRRPSSSRSRGSSPTPPRRCGTSSGSTPATPRSGRSSTRWSAARRPGLRPARSRGPQRRRPASTSDASSPRSSAPPRRPQARSSSTRWRRSSASSRRAWPRR
jgi:tetratricopeptide (TPR) repeat protein